MNGFRYDPDHEGIAMLARDPQMASAMTAIGGVGATFARTIAKKKSGRYASSLVVTSAPVRGGFHEELRAGALIVATAPYAAKLEKNTHVLARTATHLDGRLRWYAMSPRQRARAVRASSRKRRRASTR